MITGGNKMKRILVVEDNETNMYLISFILRKNKYKVIEARTGEEGIYFQNSRLFLPPLI